MIFRWLAVLAIFLQGFHAPLVHAQTSEQVSFENSLPVVEFGKRVTFKVHITATSPISKVFIYVEPQGQPAAFYPMTLSNDGSAVYVLDVTQNSLRVFSAVHYRYRISLNTGVEVNSANFRFDFIDNRFEWKSLQNSAFHINWYGRDVDFGQQALNIAQEGLEAAEKIFPVKLDGAVSIYIYTNSEDLQTTRAGAPAWVSGHAVPDMRMLLVSIPPGPSQGLELQRQLPHELTHILQYEAYGERARSIPVWLLEGTASVAELYPNPEYANVLQRSVQQDQLIPMELLCADFPRDASGAFLAYAQSQSFVRFISQKYGASAIQALYAQYSNGLGCSEGVQTVFSMDLSELEYRWRLESLGINPAALIVQNLLPYLVFLLVILGAASVSIILSSRSKSAGAHD